MSKSLRRLALAAGAALTALVAMAPAASANYSPPSNFYLPNGSTAFDGKDWWAVTANDASSGQLCYEVVECSFETADQEGPWHENDWQWDHPQLWPMDCHGGMQGMLGGDGKFYGESVAFTSVNGFEDYICEYNEPVGRWEAPGPAEEAFSFWPGEICVHVPTGEVWLRLVMTLKHRVNGSMSGPWVTYGQLHGSVSSGGGWIPDTLEFAPGTYASGQGASGATHTAEFPLSTDTKLYPGVDTETKDAIPCGWYELNLVS